MDYKDATGLTVYPGWLMNPYDRANNYAVMANGYQLAVKRLIDPLLEDNWSHDADELIYPILFCCHQCIELNLKAAIISLHDLSSGNLKLSTTLSTSARNSAQMKKGHITLILVVSLRAFQIRRNKSPSTATSSHQASATLNLV